MRKFLYGLLWALVITVSTFAGYTDIPGSGGIPGVTFSSTPAVLNQCVVATSATTAAWGSCSSGSGISGTWGATTGNIVTTNGANTAQDSGTAVSGLAPKTAPTFATSLTCSYANVSTVAQFDASRNLVSSGVSTTTLAFLDATSSIQTQLNLLAPLANPTFTGTATFSTVTTSSATVSGLLTGASATFSQDVKTSSGCYISPKKKAIGNSGSATTIDLSTGLLFTITLNAATPTLTFSNAVDSCAYAVVLTQDSTGSRVPTFAGTSIIWGNTGTKTLSTTASAIDKLSCVYNQDINKLMCDLGVAYQ